MILKIEIITISCRIIVIENFSTFMASNNELYSFQNGSIFINLISASFVSNTLSCDLIFFSSLSLTRTLFAAFSFKPNICLKVSFFTYTNLKSFS